MTNKTVQDDEKKKKLKSTLLYKLFYDFKNVKWFKQVKMINICIHILSYIFTKVFKNISQSFFYFQIFTFLLNYKDQKVMTLTPPCDLIYSFVFFYFSHVTTKWFPAF